MTNGLFVCTLTSLLERDRPPRTIMFVCSSIRVDVPEHKARSVCGLMWLQVKFFYKKTLPRKLKAAVEADHFERDRNY